MKILSFSFVLIFQQNFQDITYTVCKRVDNNRIFNSKYLTKFLLKKENNLGL